MAFDSNFPCLSPASSWWHLLSFSLTLSVAATGASMLFLKSTPTSGTLPWLPETLFPWHLPVLVNHFLKISAEMPLREAFSYSFYKTVWLIHITSYLLIPLNFFGYNLIYFWFTICLLSENVSTLRVTILYPQHLQQCPVQNRCSLYICWLTKWMNDTLFCSQSSS